MLNTIKSLNNDIQGSTLTACDCIKKNEAERQMRKYKFTTDNISIMV